VTWTPDHETRDVEDELLAVRCQLGEPAAFDLLIARWHPPLATFVRRLTGDEEAARDIMQDVWLRVLRGIGRLREPARLRAWLFTIARRAVMDRLRAQYAEPVAEEDDEALAGVAATDDVDASADLDEARDLLELELPRLPIVEREVLTLFYLRELTLSEVAGLLELPVGTIKSRLFRARRTLRMRLEGRGVSR
jgi:RNA polymerase sigma factor (sigma-70 family)